MAVGLLGGLLAWSFASPYGTTPDESFHMTSVWCPRPGQGGCEIVATTDTGHPVIAMPAQLLARYCFGLWPNGSAACGQALSDDKVWSTRFNTTGYPGYYYDVMHVFASDDIDRMTLLVRVANSIAAVALALALLLLMNSAARRVYIWALAVTAVPGMAWLVGSAAPDSWSIFGVTTVWAGITGAFLATVRWRRRSLLAVAVLGAIFASAARSDGAVFVIIAATVPCVINWRRLRGAWDICIATAVTYVVGAAGFVSGYQVASMVATGCGVWCPPTVNPQGALHLLVNNVVYFFEWFTDAWRYTAEVQQPQVAGFALVGCAVVLVGAALARGGVTKSKMLALFLAGCLVVGPPIASLQIGHALLALGQGGLQQRYVFPALIVFVGAALTPTVREAGRYISLRTAALVWGVVTVTQAVYLHQWIRRCVTGLAGHGFNLSSGAQWWWAWGPSPMITWVIGSVGFAIASAAVVFVWWQPRADEAVALAVAPERAVEIAPAADRGVATEPDETRSEPVRTLPKRAQPPLAPLAFASTAPTVPTGQIGVSQVSPPLGDNANG